MRLILFFPWFIRIGCVWASVVLFHVIKLTYTTWKLKPEKDKKKQKAFTYVNAISVLFNCLCLLVIFIRTIPVLCESMHGIWFMFWSVSKGCLSLFQIMRWRISLSDSNLMGFSGYSKWVFYALYTMVILCTSYNVVASRFTFRIKLIDNALCMETILADNYQFLKYQSPMLMVDLLIHVIIFNLYVLKLGSITRDFQRNSTHCYSQNAASEIRRVVEKMSFLDIILMVVSIIQWLIYTVEGVTTSSETQFSVLNMVHIMGSIICGIVGFCMIERHDNIYQKYVERAVNYCCSKFNICKYGDDQPTAELVAVHISDENDDVQHGKQTLERTTDTQSKYPLSQPLGEGYTSPASPQSDQIQSLIQERVDEVKHNH